MTVNCLAHVLNLSAKALLQGLKLVDNTETSHEDALVKSFSEGQNELDEDLSDDKEELNDDLSEGNDDDLGDNDDEVAETVMLVRPM